MERGFSGWQARATCSISVRPPARCSTLARFERSRVPLPAAKMTIVKSESAIAAILSADSLALTTGGASKRSLVDIELLIVTIKTTNWTRLLPLVNLLLMRLVAGMELRARRGGNL